MYSELDLTSIAERNSEFLSKYSNKTICIAGATGFVGSWLISFLDFANVHFSTNIEVIALSRGSVEKLKSELKTVAFCNLDLGTKKPSFSNSIQLIVNAATPSSPSHGGNDPEQILNSSIQGTINLVELGALSNSNFINLSSGIVSKRRESKQLDLSLAKDAYLHGKRESEELVAIANREGMIKGVNLRLYAFAGPGISLIDHFAVGNFLNDALQRKPISIKGNPATKRSYLYPTDLVSNILAAENVQVRRTTEIGSTNWVSMENLAVLINKVTGNKGIHQFADYGSADSYFPTTNQLLVEPEVTLENGIKRWAKWLNQA
jgi:nucleoside-diphosphate-sugar epimerase